MADGQKQVRRLTYGGLLAALITLLTAVFPSLIGQMAERSLRLPFAVCMALFAFAAALVVPLSHLPAHKE